MPEVVGSILRCPEQLPATEGHVTPNVNSAESGSPEPGPPTVTTALGRCTAGRLAWAGEGAVRAARRAIWAHSRLSLKAGSKGDT